MTIMCLGCKRGHDVTPETLVNLTFTDCWDEMPLSGRVDMVSELGKFVEFLMKGVIKDLRAEPETLAQLAKELGIDPAELEAGSPDEVRWPEDMEIM